MNRGRTPGATLDLGALRARLVDSPPDPWDDHPLLEEEGEERSSGGPLALALESGALSERRARVFVFEMRRELDEVWEDLRGRVGAYAREVEYLASATSATQRRRSEEAPWGEGVQLLNLAAEKGGFEEKADAKREEEADDHHHHQQQQQQQQYHRLREGGRQSLKADFIDLATRLQGLVYSRMQSHRTCMKLIHALAVSLERDGEDDSFEAALSLWILSHPLFSDQSLESAWGTLQRAYAVLYTQGDELIAQSALYRKIELGEGISDYFNFGGDSRGGHRRRRQRRGLGLQLGASIVLSAWVAWDCLGDNGGLGKVVWHEPALACFRGLGNIVLLHWAWGACVWVWGRSKVDYRRCFRFADPDVWRAQEYVSESPHGDAWSLACDLSTAWLAAFLVFFKATRGLLMESSSTIPPQLVHVSPFLLFMYTVYRSLTPWKRRGKPLLAVLGRVMVSPLSPVGFIENYVGDVLTSTVRVAVDLSFSIVFFLSGAQGWLKGDLVELASEAVGGLPWFRFGLAPFLIACPLWWRFHQTLRCAYDSGKRWPHLGNSLKYASALALSVFGAVRPGLHRSPLWIGAFIGATLYQFVWDVAMDWGLVSLEEIGSMGGRYRLAFRERRWPLGVYLAAVAFNLVLRFGWTVTILPEHVSEIFSPEVQSVLSPFVAAAEVVRRSMWGILRVDHEDHNQSNLLGDELPLDCKPFQRMELSGGGVNGGESSLYSSVSRKKLLWELVGWTILLAVVVWLGTMGAATST